MMRLLCVGVFALGSMAMVSCGGDDEGDACTGTWTVTATYGDGTCSILGGGESTSFEVALADGVYTLRRTDTDLEFEVLSAVPVGNSCTIGARFSTPVSSDQFTMTSDGTGGIAGSGHLEDATCWRDYTLTGTKQ